MIETTGTVNLGDLSKAIRRLAGTIGISNRAAARAEVGSILKTCVLRTKVATQAQVDRRARNKAVRALGYTAHTPSARGDVTVNSGFKSAPFGRVWVRVRNGGGKNNFLLAMGPNFGTPTGKAVFNKYRAHQSATTQQWVGNVLHAAETVPSAVDQAIPLARRSVGLARQSFVQMADAVDIRLEDVKGGQNATTQIAKARAALASNGQPYLNGSGKEFDAAQNFIIRLVNTLPYNTKIGIDRTLTGVALGRVSYFRQNVDHGALTALRDIQRAYPNMFSGVN